MATKFAKKPFIAEKPSKDKLKVSERNSRTNINYSEKNSRGSSNKSSVKSSLLSSKSSKSSPCVVVSSNNTSKSSKEKLTYTESDSIQVHVSNPFEQLHQESKKHELLISTLLKENDYLSKLSMTLTQQAEKFRKELCCIKVKFDALQNKYDGLKSDKEYIEARCQMTKKWIQSEYMLREETERQLQAAESENGQLKQMIQLCRQMLLDENEEDSDVVNNQNNDRERRISLTSSSAISSISRSQSIKKRTTLIKKLDNTCKFNELENRAAECKKRLEKLKDDQSYLGNDESHLYRPDGISCDYSFDVSSNFNNIQPTSHQKSMNKLNGSRSNDLNLSTNLIDEVLGKELGERYKISGAGKNLNRGHKRTSLLMGRNNISNMPPIQEKILGNDSFKTSTRQHRSFDYGLDTRDGPKNTIMSSTIASSGLNTSINITSDQPLIPCFQSSESDYQQKLVTNSSEAMIAYKNKPKGNRRRSSNKFRRSNIKSNTNMARGINHFDRVIDPIENFNEDLTIQQNMDRIDEISPSDSISQRGIMDLDQIHERINDKGTPYKKNYQSNLNIGFAAVSSTDNGESTVTGGYLASCSENVVPFSSKVDSRLAELSKADKVAPMSPRAVKQRSKQRRDRVY